MSRANTNRQKQYTLIELVVTLTILIIMTTLLMTSLQLVKENTKNSACQNNLKQQFAGSLSYSSDNSGWLPVMEVEGGGHYWHDVTYYHEIAPYCGYESEVLPMEDKDTTRVFHTETGKRKTDDQNAEAPVTLSCPSKENRYRMSYMWNSVGFGLFGTYKDNPHKERVKITSPAVRNPNKPTKPKIPSDVLIITENHKDYDRSRIAIQGTYSRPHWLGFRHQTKSNLIFFDGHIEQRFKEDMCLRDSWGYVGGALDMKDIGALWFGNRELW